MGTHFLNHRLNRRSWWLSLGLLIASVSFGYWLHLSGLSFWRQRISFWHTTIGILVSATSLAIFVFASISRVNDMRATNKIHWLLIIPPLWILTLGLVPTSTEDSPNPFRATYGRARKTALISAGVVVAVWLGFLFLQPSTLPKAQTRPMSFEDCNQFIRKKATSTDASITRIVDTDIMTMVRLSKDSKSALITCSRPDGKLIVTRSD